MKEGKKERKAKVSFILYSLYSFGITLEFL